MEMEEDLDRCRYSLAHLVFLKHRTRRLERFGYDFLSFLHDRRQMIVILKALRVDLVDVLGAGRPGREPATIGHDLQPADGSAVTRGGGQFGRNALASEGISGNRGGRQLLQARLLSRCRWRIDPRVVWRAALTC